mmetsp:Transcript_25142/g.69344  ORF Transcript_25142/g.69344 Transcript_25142/m.69344 type:complete len:98 (-) Transcript_25142:101-394(-)
MPVWHAADNERNLSLSLSVLGVEKRIMRDVCFGGENQPLEACSEPMLGVPVWFGLVPAILFVVDVWRGIAAVVRTKTLISTRRFAFFAQIQRNVYPF